MTARAAEDMEMRRAYKGPKLTVYGSFSELTAAGSGFETETRPGRGSPNRRL